MSRDAQLGAFGLALAGLGCCLIWLGAYEMRDVSLKGYREEAAIRAAYLSAAAYCGPPKWGNDSQLLQWRCGPACDVTRSSIGTDIRVVHKKIGFAYIAGPVNRSDPNASCLVGFRGTYNNKGWMADLQAATAVDLNSVNISCFRHGKPCYAGKGFINTYLLIREQLKEALTSLNCEDYYLEIVGHSLGGALAMYAMMDLWNDGYRKFRPTYTFGQPRVGDQTFVDVFRERFGDVAVYRVTHAADPVPHLPAQGVTRFRQLPTEVYYPDNGTEFRVCNGNEDPTCSNEHRPVALRPFDLSAGDHTTYLMVYTGIEQSGSHCSVDASLLI